jgi:hypothetical protein
MVSYVEITIVIYFFFQTYYSSFVIGIGMIISVSHVLGYKCSADCNVGMMVIKVFVSLNKYCL